MVKRGFLEQGSGTMGTPSEGAKMENEEDSKRRGRETHFIEGKGCGTHGQGVWNTWPRRKGVWNTWSSQINKKLLESPWNLLEIPYLAAAKFGIASARSNPASARSVSAVSCVRKDHFCVRKVNIDLSWSKPASANSNCHGRKV